MCCLCVGGCRGGGALCVWPSPWWQGAVQLLHAGLHPVAAAVPASRHITVGHDDLGGTWGVVEGQRRARARAGVGGRPLAGTGTGADGTPDGSTLAAASTPNGSTLAAASTPSCSWGVAPADAAEAKRIDCSATRSPSETARMQREGRVGQTQMGRRSALLQAVAARERSLTKATAEIVVRLERAVPAARQAADSAHDECCQPGWPAHDHARSIFLSCQLTGG